MALTLGIMAVAQEWQSTPFRSPAICPEPSELRDVIPRVADSGRNAGLLGGAVSFRVLGIGTELRALCLCCRVAPCAAAHGVGTSPRVPALFLAHGWGCHSPVHPHHSDASKPPLQPRPVPPSPSEEKGGFFFFNKLIVIEHS